MNEVTLLPDEPPPPSTPTPPPRRFGCMWAAVAVLGILVVGGVTAVYLFVYRGPATLMDAGVTTAERSYSLARKVARDVIHTLQFQPRITIGDEVAFEQNRGILEMATAERRFTLTYTWENSWLGSKKQIMLQGKFIAKAGYDLTQPFTVDIGRDGREVHATVPPAKILAVELLSQRVLEDENGFWNSLTPQDREQAINGMLALARQRVDQSNLKQAADTELMQRLQRAADQQNPLKVAVTVSGSERAP